ncbi:MAG: DivIVA domain-containing protein [Actinobacteria bacterium]|nr:DivIVA domain-containing protein [Actinomycetota bacterium]
MRRKKGQEQEAPATGELRVTPADVQGVEFKLAFRGYSERDVDAFLDRVTEDLSSYLEENELLRQGLPPATADPSGDRADADAILASAREEAAAIVRRAEQDAAEIRAAAGTGSAGDARTALAPFLNREREFLQSLGSLVQTHAEEIKQMVLAIRARTEAAAPTGGGAPATGAAVAGTGSEPAVDLTSGTGAPEFEPASTAEMRERMAAESTFALSDEPEDAQPEEPDTVVVDSATEPVFSTEGSPGSAPAADRRERSLRELFWGED